ncbi:MAG TPA: hypothetical protein VHC23_04380 [Jatrophihabitans sp.]|nr:hypothetical protein [Jatrophihabitans sp.]
MTTTLLAIETVVLAVLCVLVAGLLRAYGTVLRRLHQLDGGGDRARDFELLPLAPTGPDAGPPPAAAAARSVPELGPAHDIAGETLSGELVSARVAGVAHDTLILFLSSGCTSCETFWLDLARPGAIHLPAGTRLLVVPQAPADEDPALLRDLAPPGVDVVLSSEAWRDYEVPGSPHVVYVDGRSGRIRGEGTGQSLAQVAELLARSTGDAGFVTGGPSRKPNRDREQEAAVDRELLANGILPGDPRLYGGEDG